MDHIQHPENFSGSRPVRRSGAPAAPVVKVNRLPLRLSCCGIEIPPGRTVWHHTDPARILCSVCHHKLVDEGQVAA